MYKATGRFSRSPHGPSVVALDFSGYDLERLKAHVAHCQRFCCNCHEELGYRLHHVLDFDIAEQRRNPRKPLTPPLRTV